MTAATPAHVRVMRRSIRVGECLIWQGSRSGKGYGTVGVGSRRDGTRRTRLVHVVVWEAARGSVPVGLELDHRCRNRACVNLDCLQPVPHSVNAGRADHSARVARLRSKTHCKYGHLYDVGNTAITSCGTRRCRQCHRIRSQRDRATARGAAA